jgi:hypothetical protein
MSVYLAVKTMEAINATMQADQGASFRQCLEKVIPHVGDAYRGADTIPFRTHMGASGLGDECPRAIWYGFRWATKPSFDARMLRLFNRGHLEEARFIALLLMIGVQVWQQDENGNQFRISDAGGHLGGSGDGVAIGIPDLDAGLPALLEFKTASEKKFLEMKANGVREANFKYYVQMQLYLGKMGITVALFMMVNKNTDEIYAELVLFDRSIYDQHLNRGVVLVFTQEPPKKMNDSAGFYKCRFCDHRPVCHLNAVPEKTCRSCIKAEVNTNGTWGCTLANPQRILTKEEVFAACGNYQRLF